MTSVVITGAGSGIGFAIATKLASLARPVVLVDRDATALEGIHADLVSQWGDSRITAFCGDVADPHTHAAAADLAEGISPPTGWVNCAGVTVRNALAALDAELSRHVVAVNQMGTLWGTAEAISRFVRSGTPGSIVNISSVHGRQAYPDHAVYEMTKAAIDALTRNAAVSYGSLGIRANAVAPGSVMTRALETSFESAPDPAAARRHLASRNPLGRIADAGEIASVVAFLLSDEASYITGQSLPVDGGWTSALGLPPDNPAARRTSGGSDDLAQ